MSGPRRPGSMIPFRSRPISDDYAEPRRTRSVTDRNGNPLELRGDLGGDPATPPPGLNGMRIMRPTEVEQRYRAMLAEPVSVTSHHEGIASESVTPLVFRTEAVDRLNAAAGEPRYRIEDGKLRDRVKEDAEQRLALEDRAAMDRMGMLRPVLLPAQDAEYEPELAPRVWDGGGENDVDDDNGEDGIDIDDERHRPAWRHRALARVLSWLPVSWQFRIMLWWARL